MIRGSGGCSLTLTKGNVPTSTRRRTDIRMLNKVSYKVGHMRRIEKKTTSQSSAEAPSYTMGAVRLNVSVGGKMKMICYRTCLPSPVLRAR